MVIAYICIAVAAFFPFVFTAISKMGDRSFDNNKPRDWIETQDGYRKRAHWVELNSFEAFPVFAIAVLVAQIGGVKPAIIDGLAAAFIVLRCVYGWLYLADKASMRSIVWAAAILCCVALYAMAVLTARGGLVG